MLALGTICFETYQNVLSTSLLSWKNLNNFCVPKTKTPKKKSAMKTLKLPQGEAQFVLGNE